MSQPCAITTCKRASRAPCDCCKQNLCLQHLNEHNAALVAQLNPLSDEINAVGSRLAALNVVEMTGDCRQKLEQWCVDCHEKIDSFFKQKCQELSHLMVQKVDKQRDEIDRLRSQVTKLMDEQEATRQDIEQLTFRIEDLKQEMENIERTPVQIGVCPLVVDNSWIHFKEQFDPNTLSSVCKTIQRSADSRVGLASNDRFLLIHQQPNLCLINQELTIVKQTIWTHGDIHDMCWSSALERFIVITTNEVYLLDESTMSIEHVQAIQKQMWYSCTCSDTSLFLSTNVWGSSILEFNLLPSIVLVKQWKSPQTCAQDEIIHFLIYNKGRIALMIVNRSQELIRMELRSSSTLDRLWSLPVDTVFNKNIRVTCCLFQRNEWLVIDRNASRLLCVTKEGEVQSIYNYNPVPYRAHLFGTNILVVSSLTNVKFHRL